MRSRESARRFFAGLTEYAFHSRLGVADTHLVDYIAELLARFVHRDAVYLLKRPNGRRLDQVADMLEEAQFRTGTAKREAHRQIGDFTLFWVGVYPEALKRLQRRGSKDNLVDYHQQGKRAYRVAAEIPVEEERPSGDLLARLSHNFELCAYGLGEVRREWERRDDEGDTPLLIN